MEGSKKRLTLAITAVLLSAAIIALVFMIKDTRAGMVYGNGADVDLEMSSLSVELIENGEAVSGDDQLLKSLKDVKTDPGYRYEEKISAKNTGNVEEFVRIVVKKYWKDSDGKRVDLDPSLIRLSYADQDYNRENWVMDPSETTKEQSVYYYRTPLAGGQETELLFSGIKADQSVADKYEITKNGNKITAEYEYDGISFGVDMTVQSVQSADGADAVRSTWGNGHVNADYGVIVIK